MGRPKGSENKHQFKAEELAKEMGVDPLKFLLEVVEGRHPDHLRDRVQAAKEACKYLYSAKHAVDVAGEMGFKVIICDYRGKKENG